MNYVLCIGLVCALAAAAVFAAPPIVKPDPVPSDATVVFDGSNLDGLKMTDGSACKWKLVDDGEGGKAVEVVAGTGNIMSAAKHGSAQIHVEFMVPTKEADPNSKGGQNDGNSGVYLQGRYELQVLNSYENETYPDGQCGAIYKQYAPLVNACRRPGEWQTYDITFHAAEFNDAGERTAPARMTVVHNGVLIQDNVELHGVTGGNFSPESAEPGSLYFQDHAHPVRYRNIWIRPLN